MRRHRTQVLALLLAAQATFTGNAAAGASAEGSDWCTAPRDGSPVHGQVRVDGRRLFTLAQPQPLLRGWFALRTTASRLQLRQFRVLHCTLP